MTSTVRKPTPRATRRATPGRLGKITVYLKESENPLKKFKVTVCHPDGRQRTVHFGGIKENGEKYHDFTIHKNPDAMRQYLKRHAERENWAINGIDTAGFWARWLLWSKPTLLGAIKLTEKRFGIEIKRT